MEVARHSVNSEIANNLATLFLSQFSLNAVKEVLDGNEIIEHGSLTQDLSS
jgi:hypothetical protein